MVSDALSHPQLSNLLQLAVSLVANLGLNSGPGSLEKTKLAFATNRKPYGDHLATKLLTLEERRAALGCFYLTSVFASLGPQLFLLLLSALIPV